MACCASSVTVTLSAGRSCRAAARNSVDRVVFTSPSRHAKRVDSERLGRVRVQQRDDLRVGIFDGGEDAVGHFGALHVHVGVNGGDDHVELREDFVVQIERPFFRMSTSIPASRRMPGILRAGGADFLDLLEGALFVHAVGDGDGFASGR